MKKYSHKRSQVTIKAAQSSGTTFYKITLDEAIEALKGENEILLYMLRNRGWSAIDLEGYFWGSAVEGETFYLCDTDGMEIDIRGEMFDPEQVIDELGLSAIEPYVQDATPEVIKRNITEYELAPLDLDRVAFEMLKEGYHFEKIYEAAKDASLVDTE